MEKRVCCVDCGQVVDLEHDLVHYTENGDVCEDCYENDYGVCEHDGETVVRLDEMYLAYRISSNDRVEEIHVCEASLDRDFVRCNNGEYWFKYNVYETAYGRTISQEDFYDNYFTCGDCGGIFHIDEGRYVEEIGETLCESCFDNYVNEVESCSIHPYNYKPDTVFFKIPGETTKLFIGTESEIDSVSGEYISGYDRASVAENFLESFNGEFYNKEDGSLRSGFEVVSHPMTYNYLMSIKDDLKKAFDYALSKGYRSDKTDTCGLHIHISRAAFNSTNEINNFVYLFEKFYNQVLKFSRRTEYSMQRWADRYGVYNSSDSTESFSSKLSNVTHEKYRIVNLRHRATLEVRAFKGTLNIETYIASVQFMLVMQKLATSKSLVVNNVTWRSVVKAAKFMQFDELCSYLKRRELYDIDTVRTVFKKRKKRTIFKNTLLKVIGDCGDCSHNYPLGTKVKVVSMESSRTLFCSLDSIDNATENVVDFVKTTFPSQYLSLRDVALVNEPNVPLSDYDIEFVFEDVQIF